MSESTEQSDEMTLRKARRIIALAKCSSDGHDFDVMSAIGSGDPRRVVCGRCGRSWGITQTDPRT